MTEQAASIIRESSKGIARLTAQDVFAPSLVLILITIFSVFLWLFRIDWREERHANIAILEKVLEYEQDNHDHLIELGATATERDHRRATENKRAVNVKAFQP